VNGVAETQLNLELTLGFNGQSNKGKKIIWKLIICYSVYVEVVLFY
jgi:hypothetical protein